MNYPGLLSRYILRNTTAEIFKRGLEYFKKDRVQDFSEDEKHIFAVVAGTDKYRVQFWQGAKHIKAYCACPYAVNEDYCKHVAAVAIFRDVSKGLDLPTADEIEMSCLKIDHGFGHRISAMFQCPLEADLDLLATASDYGSWVRPHAKIKIASPIKNIPRPISLREVKVGFGKIAHLANRKNYDLYFCAGEVSAVLCLAYDAILGRINGIAKEQRFDIVTECIVFYYNGYLQMIDGSDGAWQIPQARILKMFSDIKGRISSEEKERWRKSLNDKIKGWGDIFQELEFQRANF